MRGDRGAIADIPDRSRDISANVSHAGLPDDNVPADVRRMRAGVEDVPNRLCRSHRCRDSVE